MTHKDIFQAFLDTMSIQKESVIKWYPNGHNAIRVTLSFGRLNGEYVFTYNGKDSWIFETTEHYIKRLKEKKL